jgi:polyisoprenyl-phosphate glycosyltransferase
MRNSIDISIIIPVYNEGESVNIAFDLILKEISKHNESYEIIFVDDGSSDDTFSYLNKIAENSLNVKVIKFASNCGSHLAIRAGLSYAKGDCACFIACDMQEPPDLIFSMKENLSDENNIIWAVRKSRKDTFSSIVFAKIFYFFARKIVSKNIPPSGASMFLISKKVLNAVNQYHEKNLTLEGLFATMGFHSKYIYYERAQRTFGKSKWSLSKKIKLFIDFFIAYSNTPIRFVSFMGILFSVIGFFWTFYVIFRTILYHDLSSGWPTLISVLLIGFGITNISLGIIGEYLWRTLDETRNRPNYIIDKSLNLHDERE